MAILPYTYYPEVKAGRVFYGSTAAGGVALPATTGTAVTFALWNTDPGKVMIPLWFAGGYASGAIAIGHFGFATQAVGLVGGATGLALAAYTAGTAKNANNGSGNNSTATFIPATATLTAGNAAGVPVYYTGMQFNTVTLGNGAYEMNHDFNGRLVLYPGQIMFACSSPNQTALFSMTLAWDEVPIASM
jgi:hypothetical protein